jgi:hypothetical protein
MKKQTVMTFVISFCTTLELVIEQEKSYAQSGFRAIYVKKSASSMYPLTY